MEKVWDVFATVGQWTRKAGAHICDYMEGEDTKTRKQRFKAGMLFFLVGIVIGFLVAPIKKGITICSNNNDSFCDNGAEISDNQNKKSDK